MSRKRKKPEAYKLKKASLTQLPSNWLETINGLKTVIKKINELILQKTFSQKKWLATLQTLQATTESIQIDTVALKDHFKSHSESSEALEQAEGLAWELRSVAVVMSCRVAKNGECNLDDLQEYVTGNISDEELSLMLENCMPMEEGVSFEEELLGAMQFKRGEIKKLIDSLLLVFNAYQHFQTQRQFLTTIGSCQIFLESGPFQSVSRSEIDEVVVMTLDAIQNVLKIYAQTGIPDYALQGPIVLELGLPPLRYGGVYTQHNNEVRISLKNLEGLSLSADYAANKHTKTNTSLESLVFGLQRVIPKSYATIPNYFTIAHELGHRIYYRGLRPKALKMWKTLYDLTTLSPEEAQLAGVYFATIQQAKSAEQALENAKAKTSNQVVLNSFTISLAKTLERIDQIEQSMSVQLMECVDAIRSSPFRDKIYPGSFSRIVWPTAYARTDEAEAFAESIIMTIWENQVSVSRFDKDLTPQEWQRFKDIMWHFIHSLRPQKLH